MRARHGGLVKHEHRIEGINSRLDGIQAAILSAKLPYLTDWTCARQLAAEFYNAALGDTPTFEVPKVMPGRNHVYHLYTIRHPNRDALAKHLAARGIQTAINYPTILPLLPAYQHLGLRHEEFPNAYRDQQTILSLPMFAEISREQQGRVVAALKEFEVHDAR